MKKKITGLVVMLVIILCLVLISVLAALIANHAMMEKNKPVVRVIEEAPSEEDTADIQTVEGEEQIWTVKPLTDDPVPTPDENMPETMEDTSEEDEEEPESEPIRPRTLFIGDSRTIDMFADSDDTIWGQVHNDIEVYAGHGLGFDFMVEAINDYGEDSFDILVTWMGANDRGDFSRYRDYYNELINDGKVIVVCTVGPMDDEHLTEWDHPYYEDSNAVKINKDMVEWACEKGISYIDMYAYIKSLVPEQLTIDEADGIHYSPRPTRVLWEHILGELITIGVR